MSSPIIKVEHLSKRYILKHQNAERYTALRDVIANKVKTIVNPKSQILNPKSEEFWALNDVSFEINQGDRVGIIGRNGAGKSTLLKILSRIVTPTKGRITIDGRAASLLEVGTGFHPELSGRENIFLNGSILGMTKKEIENKFDEIVDFAGVEKFLDTPVKRYSSGMYVRLAFSIAAHLEPDILIVDEVLAVGDAEFQKKCLGKMKDVSGQGRTVLFVSHNLQAISTLCNKGIVLHQGTVHTNATIDICLQNYYGLLKDYSFNENTSKSDRLNRTNGKASFAKAQSLLPDGGENKMWSFKYDEDLRFKFECKVNEPCDGFTFYMALKGMMLDSIITNIKTVITSDGLVSGQLISFSLTIPAQNIRPGQYDLYFAIGNKEATSWYDVIDGNINLPTLIILPVSDDPHENAGFTTIPFNINEKSIS